MKNLKSKVTISRLIVDASFVALYLLGSLGLITQATTVTVSAAEPGACYTEVANTLVPAACPDGFTVRPTQCVFVSTASSGATILDNLDCESEQRTGRLNPDGTPVSTSAGEFDNVECEDEVLTEDCPIIGYLVGGINFLSALAGMAIVASITIAGYQYMTAKDNSGQIEAAKKRITWALIALAVFIFMYAGLNFLVPGGVL